MARHGLAPLALLAHVVAVAGQDYYEEGVPLAMAFREGLKQQTLRELESRGESISIMAVGESGLGKTSLLSSIFRTELVWPENTADDAGRTMRIVEQSVGFDLEGVPFTTTLIDTPGYGDSVDLRQGFDVVSRRIDAGFRRLLLQEMRIRRAQPKPPPQQPGGAVDVVLYFFAPHRCKRADLHMLRMLRGRVSIVPVLAKADSMTADELERFRREVSATLREARIETAHPPLAIIASSRPAGVGPHGREYPWGLAESEAAHAGYVHSELDRLRRFLLLDGLLDLKAASQAHYEAYRTRALRQRALGIKALVRALLSPAQVGAGPLANCMRIARE